MTESNKIGSSLVISIFLSAKNSNPNGDPDDSGAPRQFSDGHGYITSVSFKRRIRDAMCHLGAGKVFLRSGIVVQEEVAKATSEGDAQTKPAASSKKKGRGADTEGLKSTFLDFLDVRLFGQVFANEGLRIRGAAQMGPLVSIAPVERVDDCITTSFVHNHEQRAKNEGTMGRRSFVRHAIYRGDMVVSYRQANENNVGLTDVATLVKAIMEAATEGYKTSAATNVAMLKVVVSKSAVIAPVERGVRYVISDTCRDSGPASVDDYVWENKLAVDKAVEFCIDAGDDAISIANIESKISGLV
jgi:CRISPR-associated protein Csd2